MHRDNELNYYRVDPRNFTSNKLDSISLLAPTIAKKTNGDIVAQPFNTFLNCQLDQHFFP